ncbi:uncharacterized protein O3C94_007232 [Discoglossus pictus]
MGEWVRGWIFFGMFMAISALTKEEMIAKAVESYNQGIETEFTFHLLEISLREEQDKEVIQTSFQSLPRPISNRFIRRLWRLFHKDPILSTTTNTRNGENLEIPQELEFIIKEIVCGNPQNTSHKICVLKEDSVPKYCVAYQTEHDSLKYIVTCKNMTQEYQQPVNEEEEINKNNIHSNVNEEEQKPEMEDEQSGDWGDEDEKDIHLTISRCLQCISNMLNNNKG